MLVARLLVVAMFLDQGAEHGGDFFALGNPCFADLFVNVTSFDANIDLCGQLRARSLADRQEPSNLGVAIAFKAFRDVRRNR